MGSVLNSKIDGLTITQLREIKDGRGAVLHMMRNDAPEFNQFGECYFSEILPGVVKGWKMHREQTQNLAVPVGLVRFVIYDDRDNSRTIGKFQTLDLGRPQAYWRIQIPPGLWYSFGCLSDKPSLIANCADMPHNPAESTQKHIHSKDIPYSWPKPIN